MTVNKKNSMPNRRIFCPHCQPEGRARHATPDCVLYDDGHAYCFKCRTYTPADKGVGGAAAAPPACNDAPPTPAIPPATIEERAQLYSALLEPLKTGDEVGACVRYFAKRSISPRTLKNAGVRYIGPYVWRLLMRSLARRRGGVEAMIAAGLVRICRDGKPRDFCFPFYRAGVDWLLIPYYVAGAPIYLKARPVLSKDECEARRIPRFLNSFGTTPLYNCDALRTSTGRVFIAEGEIDALSLLEFGYCAVAVPGAHAFKPQWAHLFKGRQVYLALDGDEAGRAGAEHIQKIFQQAGLPAPIALRLPDGCDVNDLLTKDKEGHA